MADAKAGEVVAGGFGAFGDVGHSRAWWPRPAPRDERTYGAGLALDQGLDAAVGEVLYPAVDTESPGLGLRGAAVPDALDAAGDAKADAGAHSPTPGPRM